jgi:Tfp pilus assembly protein PilO
MYIYGLGKVLTRRSFPAPEETTVDANDLRNFQIQERQAKALESIANQLSEINAKLGALLMSVPNHLGNIGQALSRIAAKN